jgi:hypothetical protein
VALSKYETNTNTLNTAEPFGSSLYLALANFHRRPHGHFKLYGAHQLEGSRFRQAREDVSSHQTRKHRAGRRRRRRRCRRSFSQTRPAGSSDECDFITFAWAVRLLAAGRRQACVPAIALQLPPGGSAACDGGQELARSR